MAKLIFGCGYLGGRVAQRWLDSGEPVHVATRDSNHARRFAAQGYRPLIADVTRPATLVDLPTAQTVLFAVGFDRTAGKPIHQVYVDGLAAVLAALRPGVERLIYISSTGVYGNCGGETVDEESACAPPTSEGGRACLAAEQLLLSHPVGQRAIILRLAGIYGPGRIPRVRELMAGVPIAAAAEGHLNLIHVDDAASVVLAAERRAKPPRTFNVSDGAPPSRRDYFSELARLVGAPAPTFTAPVAGSPLAERAASDKRVSNRRLLAELGVQLKYPTYREGLAAIVAEEQIQRVG